ncbi:transposase [Rathayibacter iranicus]|uniref:Transposase n=3 Tax=Rathayibacter iranicus TaxID=59737 RepID=A0AAD1ELD3_9MICO|nr:transposase family protein [Rathayibacter iranicus]AZZ54916.1 transposase [Rathayibacter iranicus]PPI62537.1 transposase [Rathayibacter iranicus]PWJ61224.1 DDE superfamily endonuclease [Rathayibacter iranicus NCPPB 2253 = VKM Ac-1602]
MTAEHYAILAERIENEFTWRRRRGRPRTLSLAGALQITLLYYRQNVTEQLIADVIGVSQSTVSRTIAVVEAMLNVVVDDEQPDVEAALRGTTAVIDGTLLPCWSWADAPELYSGKHKTTGHNCQVLADLSGRLIHISDPIAGKHHDAHAFRETGLADILNLSNTLADKGYQGTGMVTPIKKRLGEEHLPDHAKQHNRFVNTHRYVIERTIANIKTWRIFHTDYRRPLHTFHDAFNAVRCLIFFTQQEANFA